MHRSRTYDHRTRSAWRDWQRLARRATAAGFASLVAKYLPRSGDSWQRIEQRIEQLRMGMRK